jgi:hypothetical protein
VRENEHRADDAMREGLRAEADAVHSGGAHGRNDLAGSADGADQLWLANMARPSTASHVPVGDKEPAVRWVRPSDLIYDVAAAAAGRGIRWLTAVNQRGHDALARGVRRMRSGAAAQLGRSGAGAEADRASRLAPPEAFGAGADRRSRTPRSDRNL